MLEPNNKIIHPILQPHEEAKISCHVPGLIEKFNNCSAKVKFINHIYCLIFASCLREVKMHSDWLDRKV
jgi:hypothetical protein